MHLLLAADWNIWCMSWGNKHCSNRSVAYAFSLCMEFQKQSLVGAILFLGIV
jgi:hypothetical protein